jgi:hypothetical protein
VSKAVRYPWVKVLKAAFVGANKVDGPCVEIMVSLPAVVMARFIFDNEGLAATNAKMLWFPAGVGAATGDAIGDDIGDAIGAAIGMATGAFVVGDAIGIATGAFVVGDAIGAATGDATGDTTGAATGVTGASTG